MHMLLHAHALDACAHNQQASATYGCNLGYSLGYLPLQGFGSRLAPFPANYRSTEHNTDMFALAHMLGAAGAAAEQQAGA